MNASEIIKAVRNIEPARTDMLDNLSHPRTLTDIGVTDADQDAVIEARQIIEKELDECGYMVLDLGDWVPVQTHAEAVAILGRTPESHEYRPRPRPQIVRYVADGRTVYGVYDNGKSAAVNEEASAEAAMFVANEKNLKLTTADS